MDCVNNEKIYLNNIFIIDWDDTLFPTTWVNENSINLNSPESVNDYKLYFIELDKAISSLLATLNNMGQVYIVTNANINWIKACLNVLVETKKTIIKFNIRIVSARDMYSSTTSSPTEWKINTFQDILKNVIFKMEANVRGALPNTKAPRLSNTFINIISLGDAQYEYMALLNLDSYFKSDDKNINYLLKSIKFIDKPSFDYVIDQLQVVRKSSSQIVNKLGYVDLKFRE